MKKMKLFSIGKGVLTFGLFLTFVGCGGFKSESVQAPKKISDSFSTATVEATDSTDQTFDLVLKRRALDKEYLLQGEMIPQTVAAMGYSIRSRVVMFRQRGKKVFLIEAAKGNVVTTDLPQSIILAEIPIVSSNNEALVLDFNAGMSQLYVGRDLTAQDYKPKTTGFEEHSLRKSYIQEMYISKNEKFVIRQVAQTNSNGSMVPLEVRYYLSPYTPDENYKPLPSTLEYDRYAFFETSPMLTSVGTKEVNYIRWNPSKAVTYAISANTPKEYRDAIREGILYWNQAIGEEIITVVDAPEGVTAPNPDYNIVQWVPYDRAGYAYADIQADPRTGETLHAQVFLPSAFSFSSQRAARELVRRLRSSKSNEIHNLFPMKILGFEREDVCHYDPTAQLIDSLEVLIASDASDEVLLKASQDYLRMITAHEVGHTIGLRHNFAGSLAANYSVDRRPQLFADYLTHKSASKETVMSSSVMEYTPAIESLLMGDQMKQGMAFNYDVKAMKTLYREAKYKNEEWPLFCTDSGASVYYDCERFDAGASPVQYYNWTASYDLDKLANKLIEAYIASKISFPGVPSKPISAVNPMNPTVFADSNLKWRTNLFRQLTKKSSILRVQRQLDVAADFNRDITMNAENLYLALEIQSYGGFDRMFFPLSPEFADNTMAKMEVLLNDVYVNGTFMEGRSFEFTPEEIVTIKKNSRIFLDRFVKEYNKQELKVLAGKNVEPKDVVKFSANPIATNLATYLATRADTVLFEVTETGILGEIEVPNPELAKKVEPKKDEAKDAAKPDEKKVDLPKTVKKIVYLPKPFYSFEERMLAVVLLDPARSEDVMWGAQERAVLKDKFNKMIENTFGTGVAIDKLKLEKMPRDIAQWVTEALKIQGALNKL